VSAAAIGVSDMSAVVRVTAAAIGAPIVLGADIRHPLRPNQALRPEMALRPGIALEAGAGVWARVGV
jgi:hypothetical protein